MRRACTTGGAVIQKSCHFPLPCRLDLYWCKTEHAQQAVDALRQLPQLAVSMGIQSYWGTEAAPSYLDTDGWELTDLPPLAGLPLTALRLLGNVSLPPDLLQLERLHSLELYCLFELTGWSDEPWSTLAQLSQLSIIETLMPGAWAAAAPRSKPCCWDACMQLARIMQRLACLADLLIEIPHPFHRCDQGCRGGPPF